MLKIDSLFNPSDSLLGQLLTRVQVLKELNSTLQRLLPTNSIPFHASHYEKGILTLVVPSPGDATRLRYQSYDMLSQLRQYPQWMGLTSIKIKVQFPETTPQPITVTQEVKTLSQKNKDELKALADTLKSNAEADQLIASLERLSRR